MMRTVYIAGSFQKTDRTIAQYAAAEEDLTHAGFKVVNPMNYADISIRQEAATVALHANALCTITGVDQRLVKIARALGLQIGTPSQIIKHHQEHPNG